MHDVVAQVQTNARNHANKLAIVFHDQTMTYGQLNEQSRLIAAALAKRGAQP